MSRHDLELPWLKARPYITWHLSDQVGRIAAVWAVCALECVSLVHLEGLGIGCRSKGVLVAGRNSGEAEDRPNMARIAPNVSGANFDEEAFLPPDRLETSTAGLLVKIRAR